MPKKNTISISVKYDICELDLIRDELSLFLFQNNIDEDVISQIEITAYEALVNIIEHSSMEKRGEEIAFECLVTGNRIEIKIENIGERFDITEAELPDIKKHYKNGKRRGLGIYIIRTLMDSIEYSYKGNLNTLRLIKEF